MKRETKFLITTYAVVIAVGTVGPHLSGFRSLGGSLCLAAVGGISAAIAVFIPILSGFRQVLLMMVGGVIGSSLWTWWSPGKELGLKDILVGLAVGSVGVWVRFWLLPRLSPKYRSKSL
jgi:hypothetical protein